MARRSFNVAVTKPGGAPLSKRERGIALAKMKNNQRAGIKSAVTGPGQVRRATARKMTMKALQTGKGTGSSGG